MRTSLLDIRVPRNADYFEGWQLNDNEGVALDLTGDTLALSIRAVAGQGPVLASATINLFDPANGSFTVRIRGSDLSSIDGQSEVVTLAYDLRITYADGIQDVPVAGQIILTPGVTY